MNLRASNEIGAELAKILGIPNCRKLVIKFEVGKLAVVEAEYYPEDDAIKQFPSIIKKIIPEFSSQEGK